MDNDSPANWWFGLAAAPLNELGHLWCPEFGDRTDILGTVHEYSISGERFGSSSMARNITFTHWHKLPKPPVIR